MQEITLAKTPMFYNMGDEKWTTSDGTVYSGMLGSFMIFEEGKDKPEDQPYPMMLYSVDAATGHLKEALDSGFELICLDLRPGWHHLRKVK